MPTLPIAEISTRLSELVDHAIRTHERVDITRNGRRVAVLIGADDLDSIEETLEILSDPKVMEQIREAEAELARGEFFTQEQVEAELRARLANG